MVFGIGRNEKDPFDDQNYHQDLTSLRSIVNDLELKLSQYENMFNNMNQNDHEQHDQISPQQISDIYERLQRFYENEERHAAKILELEKEIKACKKECEVNKQYISQLNEKFLQTDEKSKGNSPRNDEVKVTNNLKRKKRIAFQNKSQLSPMIGGGFNETIQRIDPKGNQNANKKKRKIKHQGKSRSMSPTEFITSHYPKGQVPNHLTTFNPLKYT